ncbi:hypothetical protein [Micromonospora sp. NPDC048898]|uniref:hypothetical protein n=1 Tax=Micromonospora sp. NPDC048898 TaxID=3364260 RepID=UPI003718AFA6
MVTLVVVTAATRALIGSAGGQAIVGVTIGVGVGAAVRVGVAIGVGVGTAVGDDVADGVGAGVASATAVPAQAASAMVVTARNVRSIGASVV